MSRGERPIALRAGKQRALLALLLLHADETVSSDRLIDALWSDDPPANAAKTLQVHVSRLRKALQEPGANGRGELLVTREHGYRLEVDPEQIDAQRFERLLADGRRELAEGRPERAAPLLDEALALWRGPALADLAYESFAQDEIGRLEELHVNAQEELFEAKLALGQHAELVAPIEALIAEHPYRERLRGQLMLALYRSDRQADALEAYQDARRTLVEELGIEPGERLRALEAAILAQDPALGLTIAGDTSRERRGRRPLALAVGAVVLVAAAAVGLLLFGGDDPPSASAAEGEGQLVAVNATTGDVGRRLPAGTTPASVAALDGDLWVVDADARTLVAVDPSSGEAETLATGATPSELVAQGGSLWVTNGRPSPRAQAIGPIVGEVVSFDPSTRTQRASVDLPTAAGTAASANYRVNGIAAGSGAVWALTASGAVARIDPRTARITASSPNLAAMAVAAGEAGVWALNERAVVVPLDRRTAAPGRRVQLPTDQPTTIAAGPTGAWVTSSVDGTLWRIGRDGRVGAVDVGSGAAQVVAGRRRVWVANPVAGTLKTVDPVAMRVTDTIRLDGIPRALTLAGDTLWAAVSGEIAAQGTRAAGVQALPAPTCEPVQAGPGGRADLLIVSDLPLQGGQRLTATQMAQATTFVLREHGFRAGRFRLAFQSCDDSVARTGLYEDAKCAANARAYAANRDVAAVLAPLNSACSVAALPQLNRARGGPLGMLAAYNSFVGLTHPAPGVDPRLLSELYPTGRRNYLRILPTDDLQGAAAALMARQRGRTSVYVVDDGEGPWGALSATAFTIAARRVGLTIAGHETWDPGAESYGGLARHVAASGADSVYISGALYTNGAGVVRDLRAQLGPDVELYAPDLLTPLPVLDDSSGGAARGMHITRIGLLTDRLPAAGSDFVRRFAATQSGAEIQPSAVYAAQATEVLLAAIARSDGTRGSILDELFRTRVRGGLIGDFAFDENGDVTDGPITVLRVEGGGTTNQILSVEGGVVERVMRPSPSLVAEHP